MLFAQVSASQIGEYFQTIKGCHHRRFQNEINEGLGCLSTYCCLSSTSKTKHSKVQYSRMRSGKAQVSDHKLLFLPWARIILLPCLHFLTNKPPPISEQG